MTTRVNRYVRRFPARAPRLAAVAIAGAAGVTALVGGLGVAPPAHAGKGAATPLTRHLESVTLAPAVEHRLVVLHPLHRTVLERLEIERVSAHAVPAVRIGAALAEDGRRPDVQFLNEGQEQALFVPGTVVRFRERDYVVPEYAVARPVTSLTVPVAPLSPELDEDEAAVLADEAPRCLPGLLPPTVRWMTKSQRRDREIAADLDTWLGGLELTPPRHSVADLAEHPTLAKRVKDYMKRLGSFGQAPKGTEVLGYAALLDGFLVGVETYANGDDFRAAWPGILQGLAVECAVEELRQNLIDEDIPPSGDPDRYLRSIKERLLAIYPERPDWDDVIDEDADHRLMRVTPRTGDAVRALVHEDRVTHLLLLTDPEKRRREAPGEELEPGVIDRKGRPTEAEKRFQERRQGREPPIPTPDGE